MEQQVSPKRKPNPKRLEKTLFVNHKEDQALEKRLASISLTSRLRMMELDRERINLKNEYRLSRRRQLPNPKPRSSSPTHSIVLREPRRTSLDPVNAYLLNEYRRVGEVIPSILMSLSAKEEKKVEFIPQRVPEHSDPESVGSEEPDMAKIFKLIRNVKKIRHTMAASKRLDGQRTKVNFGDLMKDIEAKEKVSSPSDTYTDGACVLLRRKMNKMRRDGTLVGQRKHGGDGMTSDQGEGHIQRRHSMAPGKVSDPPVTLPSLALTRGSTTLGMPGRQKPDVANYMKNQLMEENEFITRTKVSKELENYDRIQGRIGTFMDNIGHRKQSIFDPDLHQASQNAELKVG